MTALDAAAPAPQSAHTRLAFAALIAGGVAIGFSPIFVKLSDLAPLASGFYRLGLAVPFLLLLQAVSGKPAQQAQPRRGDGLLLVLAGVLFAADIVFWHLSLFLTSVADATLLANTSSVMVAAVAVVVFGERMKPLFAAGLALAIAGVGVLALQKVGGIEPRNRMLGDGMALAAAVAYTAYLLLVSRLRRRHSAPKVVLVSTVASALVILPLAVIWSPAMLPATAGAWAVVIALALIAHVGGQGLITYALAHLPAAFSSLTAIVQAAVAAVAAWAIFGEELTAMKIASAAAILAGVAVCRFAGTD